MTKKHSAEYTIGASLRMARTASNMTGDHVAAQIGLSAPAYRRYERDETMPGIDRIKQLAKLYKCTLDDLILNGGRPTASEINTGAVKVARGTAGDLNIHITVSAADLGITSDSDNVPHEPALRKKKNGKTPVGHDHQEAS